MTNAIEISDVHKQYGDFTALRGVTFSIPRGGFFGLLGPNGAGKSTLIHCIAGLSRLTSGRISVMGHDVARQYRQARHALGVVPQELVYDPFFTVESLLHIQAGYYGRGREAHAWIDRLLDALELDDKRHNTMRQLSGGMKRRVLIAQALVHKPPVVILDEPTAGVDVELRRALWNFTRELHDEGHTIVLTTHYLEEAETLCDQIAILHRGELKALESTRDVLSRHPFRFLRLNLEQADAVIPGGLDGYVVERSGGDVELRLPRGQHGIIDVLDAFRSAGVKVGDVQTREPSLEDVFVELTGEGEGGA